jgi:hypothetical protein
MRSWRLELYRALAVVAFIVAVAALATGPRQAPKVAARLKPEPVILATAMDSNPPAHCLLPPRDKAGDRLIGEKSDDDKTGRRKKIIACG